MAEPGHAGDGGEARFPNEVARGEKGEGFDTPIGQAVDATWRRVDSRAATQSEIGRLVAKVGHYLPAQGPISVFIHHNTLHAFEDLPFEDAVVQAGQRFGCEPLLSERVYREELRAGRISGRDLEAVLALELGGGADEWLTAHVQRRELWRRVLVHGIPPAKGADLKWLLEEGDALQGLRPDLPGDARQRLAPGAGVSRLSAEDGTLARALWAACLRAVSGSPHRPAVSPPPPSCLRDRLLAHANLDLDESIRPVLIRFVAAFLDQGIAHVSMPGRERGLYACFTELYGHRLAGWCGDWAGELATLIADDRAMGQNGEQSLTNSLDDLGVPEIERVEFLVGEGLWLRGWAGMVHEFETRPDRAPQTAVPATLTEFLAVQLLLTRAALRHAARTLKWVGSLGEVRASLGAPLPAQPQTSTPERTWPLFQAAQLVGLNATMVEAMSGEEIGRVEAELELLRTAARRLFHEAYERRLRHRFYDAVVAGGAPRLPSPPTFQAIFCIDEREESIRRHLEEVEPGVETFGTAGFFGVAMYFQGAHAARGRPLCPVAITPRHFVAEDAPSGSALDRVVDLRAAWRWVAARARKGLHTGTRTFGRGALLTTLLGITAVVPLVLRVLFPWLRRSIAPFPLPWSSSTRLRLERAPGTPPLGEHWGFTLEEMGEIVASQLEPMGLSQRLAPVVLVLGHGSSSLNNPHESAHDCGACGGGQGGPNARAFAQMANDPHVRALLAARGIRIPEETWFVGGQRNTASNDVLFYDEDLVPHPLRALLAHAQACVETARRREAHERARRFESAPASWLPDDTSLLHVQARSVDLAQTRPEYGHATNAFCVIGRRHRTRGLFLDRRAFLISYDPETDSDGERLSRLLTAVGPVVVGISLEYFFGFVDPCGYGCGTKLPHNVTGLLGVMDGAQSDLRTGLPWQMLEIHEPVRLTVVVEAAPETLERVLRANAYLWRLILGRWVFFAALDPAGLRLVEIRGGGQIPYQAEEPVQSVLGPSRAHYADRRGHLPFVRVACPSAEGG